MLNVFEGGETSIKNWHRKMDLLGTSNVGIFHLTVAIVVVCALTWFILYELVPKTLKRRLKAFGCDISRRSHAYISCSLTKTYNAAVVEKKREMFDKVAHFINSNDVKILEIGAGSGANLDFYPEDANIQFLAVDPNPYVEKYLRQRIQSYKNIQLEVFSTSYAENMKDIPSESVDCLISTIVLCSVNDQEKVLSEVKRVLKPGCPFFFMEHIAAKPGSYLKKAQKLLNIIWRTFFDGCNVVRETLPAIENAGFQEVKYETFDARLDYLVCLLRPHIFGYATK